MPGHITSVFARRNRPHGSGLGVHRCVVKQTIALLNWFRRLRIRWEIRCEIHHGPLTRATASSAGDASNDQFVGSLGNPADRDTSWRLGPRGHGRWVFDAHTGTRPL